MGVWTMWPRVAGALVVTLGALGLLDYLGVSALLDGRAEDMRDVWQERGRDLFWLSIFALVMATSVLAAARRGLQQLKRVKVRDRS